jgi:predicted transcriptional regulator
MLAVMESNPWLTTTSLLVILGNRTFAVKSQKPMSKPPPVPTPTGAELEALSILWALQPGEMALKLAQVHDRIGKKRAAFDQPPPALTTVSTTLRNAVSKGLLQEVKITPEGVQPFVRSASRTSLISPRSAPKVAYQAAYTASAVMAQMFRDLANAYPLAQKYQAIVDMAEALGLPAETIAKIKKLLPRK